MLTDMLKQKQPASQPATLLVLLFLGIVMRCQKASACIVRMCMLAESGHADGYAVSSAVSSGGKRGGSSALHAAPGQ